MFAETGRLPRPDGASIAFHYRSASGKARGILLICHGLAEHSRRYGQLAERLGESGFHTYAHDHRGHGETKAEDAAPGRFARRNGAETVVADLLAMRDMAVSLHGSLPVILLGQSMGGLIAMNAALESPQAFHGAAIWSTGFHAGVAGKATRAILRLERMLKGSDVPSDMLARLTFRAWAQEIADARTGFDWLSRNEEAVAAYVADPLCGFDASVSLWLDISDLVRRALARPGTTQLRRDFPFHLAGGGADPATRHGRDIEWFANHLKRRGFSNISKHIYSGMRHETWNEIGSDIALSEFAGWCERVCEPQGGKAVS